VVFAGGQGWFEIMQGRIIEKHLILDAGMKESRE